MSNHSVVQVGKFVCFVLIKYRWMYKSVHNY